MSQFDTVMTLACAAIPYDCGGEPHGPTHLIIELALKTGQISQVEHDKLLAEYVPRWIQDERNGAYDGDN